MGACVSSHKDPDSTMSFHFAIGSKAKKLFAPAPTKERAQSGEIPLDGFDFNSKTVDSGFGFRSPYFGSKEEAFLDSRAWLDSDCEDDFFSVNGEFTPSRGSTPDYQTSILVTSQLTKAIFTDRLPDSKSEPSPTGRRKLADLLQETLTGEQVGDLYNVVDGKVEVNGKSDVYKTNIDQHPNSVDGTPYLSGTNSICSSERTPNIDFENAKEKTRKAPQCCLPSLIHSLSFKERKKQALSPGRRSGG